MFATRSSSVFQHEWISRDTPVRPKSVSSNYPIASSDSLFVSRRHPAPPAASGDVEQPLLTHGTPLRGGAGEPKNERPCCAWYLCFPCIFILSIVGIPLGILLLPFFVLGYLFCCCNKKKLGPLRHTTWLLCGPCNVWNSYCGCCSVCCAKAPASPLLSPELEAEEEGQSASEIEP